MNDKEQERCSDDAGPSEPGDVPKWVLRPSLHIIFLVFCLAVLAIPAATRASAVGIGLYDGDELWSDFLSSAEEYRTNKVYTTLPNVGVTYPLQEGLSMSLHAGLLLPNHHHANFYRGIETNANTIDRVMHSELYGTQIWTDLTEQNLISSAVANYQQLTVAEYGDMRYRMAIQVGMGFRYDYGNGWGWLLRFDYAKLNAYGAFLISARNNTGVLTNQGQYVQCAVSGQEKRINIDCGISRKFRLNNGFDIGLEVGAQLNNTKVVANDIQIAGRTYSILDVWGGEYPGVNSYSYEYINQGGVGYGGFVTLNFGLTLPSYSALTLAYTCYYNQITLEGYTAFAPQHLITLRFDLSGYHFFD